MNFIEIICFKYGLFKLSNKKVKKWHQNRQIDKIVYAAKNGNYLIRLQSIRLLASQLTDESVKTQLIKMIDDEVEIVANAAISLFNETKDKSIISKIKASRNKMRRNQELLSAAKKIIYTNEPRGEFYNPKEKLMDHLNTHSSTFDIPFSF